MTTEELMALADQYAWAMAQYEMSPSEPARDELMRRRAALEEALNMTSCFGGL